MVTVKVVGEYYFGHHSQFLLPTVQNGLQYGDNVLDTVPEGED